MLILAYAANLVYTLVTHRDVFGGEASEPRLGESASWPVWISLAGLAGATAVLALEAEMLSDVLASTATSLGLTPFFLGVVVLPLLGNAAEYFAAVYFARQDRMDLVMTIAVGATIQIARSRRRSWSWSRMPSARR